MMLLTKANRTSLPALYSTENVTDPIAQVKFFDPTGSLTLYATEFDGDDLFFGWVEGPYPELGIERDRHFTPTPLSGLKRGGSPDSEGRLTGFDLVDQILRRG